MMEKEQPDSMATVQMTKADYAASEVYSTTSEPPPPKMSPIYTITMPVKKTVKRMMEHFQSSDSSQPPAYKRQSNSVQIAKIIGLTVIASTFIFGAFLLASTYLQARASCDQMQTLDNILEKELMLETLQQELPKAEALLSGRDGSDNDLQSLDKEMPEAKKTKNTQTESESSDSDSSFSDSDESEELNRVQIKMPLELSLSDLANAILEQNQKSRMNCVIERRRAEELVDTPNRAMPFGFQMNVEPKKRITGERMAIFCESGSAIKDDEPQQQTPREVQIPIQRVPIPFGAIPQQYPLTHMPQQQMPVPPQIPQFVIRQIIAHQEQQQQQAQQQFQQQQQQAQQQFQQQQPRAIPLMVRQMMPPAMQQMPPQMQQLPVPDTIMRAPRPEGEIRIHLQRIPIPIQMLQGRPNVPKESEENDSSSQEPGFPFREAFGLTADDLRKIQMMAEERIQHELRTLAAEAAMNNESDGEDDDSDSGEDSQENAGTQQPMMQQNMMMQQQSQEQQQQQSQQQQSDEQDKSVDPAILQVGRANFARSVKIDLPVSMVQPEAQAEPERPHFVQPRSVPRDIAAEEK